MTDASGGDTGGGEDGSGARGPRAVAVADGGSAVRAIVSAEASAPKAPRPRLLSRHPSDEVVFEILSDPAKAAQLPARAGTALYVGEDSLLPLHFRVTGKRDRRRDNMLKINIRFPGPSGSTLRRYTEDQGLLVTIGSEDGHAAHYTNPRRFILVDLLRDPDDNDCTSIRSPTEGIDFQFKPGSKEGCSFCNHCRDMDV